MINLVTKSRFILPSLLFYFLLALFSIRTFLFQPGTLGHHWDWTIYPLAEQNCNLAKSVFSEWNEQNLGTNFGLTGINRPIHFFLHGLGCFGLNGNFISRFLIVFGLTFAGFFMFLLMKKWVTPNNAFFSGLIYAFSPYFYNEIISGATGQIISFAFIPLAVRFFYEVLKKPSFKNIAFTSLALIGVSQSLQNFVLTNVIFVFIILAYGRTKEFWSIWSIMKSWFWVLIIWMFLSAFWFIPALIEFNNLMANQIITEAKPLIMENLRTYVPSIQKAFLTLGYWDDFFEKALINNHLFSFWVMTAFLLFAFIILVSILFSRRPSLIFLGGFLSSLIFVTGLKEPLEQVIFFVFQHFPLMELFRSPQRFLTLPIFFFSLLLGLSLKQIKIRTLRFLLFFASLVFISPFFQGNFNHSFDDFQLSSGWKKVAEISQKEKNEFFRFFVSPSVHSPGFLANSYQKENQGGDLNLFFHPHPFLITNTFRSDQSKIFKQGEWLLNLHLPESLSILNLAGVKYLIIRKDVKPVFSPFENNWSFSKINQFLEERGLEKAFEDETLILWQAFHYLPLLYTIEKEPEIIEEIGGAKLVVNQKEMAGPPFSLTIPNFDSRKKYQISFDYLSQNPELYLQFNQYDEENSPNFFQRSSLAPNDNWQNYNYEFIPRIKTNKAELIFDFDGDSLNKIQIKNLQLKDKQQKFIFREIKDYQPVFYQKIQPWYYKIKLGGIKKEQFLVLNFHYHPGWRLKVNGQLLKPTIINQFANGWKIDEHCVEKEAALVFIPQYHFLLGALISGGTLLAVICLLLRPLCP